jgi:hypothetical protein
MNTRYAYVNLPHGNDLTAELDKPWLPFASMSAAILAGKTVARPGAVRVNVIDQGDADPSKFDLFKK